MLLFTGVSGKLWFWFIHGQGFRWTYRNILPHVSCFWDNIMHVLMFPPISSKLQFLWISHGACYCWIISYEGKILLLVHGLVEAENYKLTDFSALLCTFLFIYLYSFVWGNIDVVHLALVVSPFLPRFCYLVFILTFKQVFNKNLDIFGLLPVSCWPHVWGPAYFLSLLSLRILDCWYS